MPRTPQGGAAHCAVQGFSRERKPWRRRNLFPPSMQIQWGPRRIWYPAGRQEKDALSGQCTDSNRHLPAGKCFGAQPPQSGGAWRGDGIFGGSQAGRINGSGPADRMFCLRGLFSCRELGKPSHYPFLLAGMGVYSPLMGYKSHPAVKAAGGGVFLIYRQL